MLKIFISLLFLLTLASCGSSQSEIDAAKNKLLNRDAVIATDIQTTGSWVQENTENDPPMRDDVTVSPQTESTAQDVFQIIPQTAAQFLEFDDLDISLIPTWEIEISWTTTADVEKIQVLFSNRGSDFPNDDYTLQTFSPGDKNFLYRASSRSKVLDFGENTYTFRAYSGKEITETRIRIRVGDDFSQLPDSTDDEENSDIVTTASDLDIADLPISTNYWEPTALGNGNVTYSQIKGFELSAGDFSNPTCSWLTEFLQGRISTWFYWNTCRDLVAGEWIFYNVIRLEGDEYVYERHYVDTAHGYYATYELERWNGVTSDNIAEKNTELKDKSFENVNIVDGLMRDVINS